MKRRLYRTAIELTNGPVTSRLLKRFSRSERSRRLIAGYARTYRINLTELDRPIGAYRTLHDFFTRKLMPESRPVSSADVVSPVDAKVEIAGDLHDGTMFLVKGQLYSLAELLGSEGEADRYRHGKYVVLYLSPADYHRIHSPVTGTLKRQYTLGAKSYPVNRAGLSYGKSPISGNYRVISEVEASGRNLLLVKVGAMFVNSIEITHAGDNWGKGEEVAYFSFGSTVVLFFEPDTVRFAPGIEAEARVRVGQALANML